MTPSAPGSAVTRTAPAGWYRVGAVEDLTPGSVRTVSGLGIEVVAWSTATGIHAADAYCPHLGTHLGHAGCVDEQGDLRCGFHGWRFAPDGTNTASSGDGPAVPAARLDLRPVRTVDRTVYVFVGPAEVEPWEPVAFPEVGDDPLREEESEVTLTAHPQVVLEGDFDAAHFGPVHGQGFVQEPPSFDGASARVAYRTEGRRPQTIEIRLDGLTRMWQVMEVGSVRLVYRADYTPASEDRTRVHTRVSVWAPDERVADRTVERLTRVLQRDVARDARIWEHRRYGGPDRLGPEDRSVTRFRRWAAAFYASAATQAS
jgi:phenylpropionate dioxygenase-like ring-hydroxylating dioxygenase large terminal subunit